MWDNHHLFYFYFETLNRKLLNNLGPGAFRATVDAVTLLQTLPSSQLYNW